MVASPSSRQVELVLAMKRAPSPELVDLLQQWKEGRIFLHETAEGVITPVMSVGEPAADGTVGLKRFVDEAPFVDAGGKDIRQDPSMMELAETDSKLRRAMKEVSDLAAFADPDVTRRVRAVRDASIGQNLEKLPPLLELRNTEYNAEVLRALDESIALIQLKSSDQAERVEAAKTLGRLKSLAAVDALKTAAKQAAETRDEPMSLAVRKAQAAIDAHITIINAAGTGFRGISLGSVLLIVAMGLAITFGLMGIINMAHGEFIAVGAYATYLVQSICGEGLKLSPFGKSLSIPGLGLANANDVYFVVALPLSFLLAALVGLLLERSVIRFLYRRPLESLLATWGVSLVMQQLLRLIFGPNNVPITSPSWLSGNWTVNDIVFGWNRVFVIGFAILIVCLTWLILNRTPLGLLIRSVMQNRNMAACMGIRTDRVNMMTFAFGCGLAGLAGAFLSQIGNVNPALGQSYIVDSFMTVVVGGVGNILGTVISALGIGMADQSLQQYLGNPVTGKILVLAAIILFLQWRPEGLFTTRSRSLD